MSSLTVVSGSPGTGKTTIAAKLADRAERGVHIESDQFYYFISNLIAPSSPEAADQNTTVITAVARAAAAYASDGYDVFLDGVFGRWYLPLLRKELGNGAFPVDYILLRTTLDDALERVSVRNAPGIDPVVRKMHDHFVDVDGLERHVVDTQGRTVDDALTEILNRQRGGDFQLDAR